jgi:hypothetical protein
VDAVEPALPGHRHRPLEGTAQSAAGKINGQSANWPAASMAVLSLVISPATKAL